MYDVDPTVNAVVLVLLAVIFVHIKLPFVTPLDEIWRVPVDPRYKPAAPGVRPTEQHDLESWLSKFKLSDDNDSDSDSDSDENFEEDQVKLENFLLENGFENVFLNNYDPENFCIGRIVDDYEKFSNQHKNRADKFCEKYKLKKPTFYGAMHGEME